MLKRKYDPTLPYRYVEYGRMSGRGQNTRSPDQQFATITETMERCRYPWQRIRTYRDNAISGRYIRKRPGLQAMLRDIATGVIKVDLVVCDTYERLGRDEEIATIRQKLMNEYGVLVVTADSNFADPTGVVGKALGMVEQVRSTEDGRVKCHNVIRGKKDAARLKRWPGGPRPFGYDFNRVVDQSGPEPVIYSVLVPHAVEHPIMHKTFIQAHESGWGTTRLARWYNENPEIPDRFKPISEFTIGYRLSNRLYIGELVWGKKCTGIVSDTRVVEPNPEEEVLRIPGFCEPVISVEIFEAVNALMEMRGEAIKALRKQPRTGKLIEPLSRGITLKYILTGLTRCGDCGAAMRPVPSGRTSKAGRRYVYYSCPRHYVGACENQRHVPEDALREAVVSRFRKRVFPLPQNAGTIPAWYPELVGLLRQEFDRYREGEPDRLTAICSELQGIAEKLAGWSISLADPKLPATVREDIAVEYDTAKRRKQALEADMQEAQNLDEWTDSLLDAEQVARRLENLGDVLAGSNATVANLEVSRHIEEIACYRDGRVVMRGTLLGLFEGAVEVLSREDGLAEPNGSARPAGDPVNSGRRVKPRRRGRLRIDDLSADAGLDGGVPDTALDPGRFDGLPVQFMWEESFFLPRRCPSGRRAKPLRDGRAGTTGR